jgi:hypothetical protein
MAKIQADVGAGLKPATPTRIGKMAKNMSKSGCLAAKPWCCGHFGLFITSDLFGATMRFWERE